jgi:hypothetical protein
VASPSTKDVGHDGRRLLYASGNGEIGRWRFHGSGFAVLRVLVLFCYFTTHHVLQCASVQMQNKISLGTNDRCSSSQNGQYKLKENSLKSECFANHM